MIPSARRRAEKLTLAILVCLAAPGIAGPGNLPQNTERLFRWSDSQLPNAVPVPPAALPALLDDAGFQQQLRLSGVSADTLIRDMLMAAEVDLGAPDTGALLIMGRPGRLEVHGASFWIVRPDGLVFRLLLAAAGDELAILDTTTGGYRDVELRSLPHPREARDSSLPSGVAPIRYRFDGESYRITPTADP